jgi:hypothetical protein
MQLKIIDNGGPCRGHPLIRGSTRDGPVAVGSRQLAVGSWQLAVGSWQLAVGSWQLAVGSWQLAVGSWQLAVWRLDPGTWDMKPGAGKLEFNYSHARDWITHTCSVQPINRSLRTGVNTDGNHRENLLKDGRMGEVCLCVRSER